MLGQIFVFIFGSIIGSFLNVCIHRMPLGESVVWPRSHCPKCKKRIPGYDNIPFLSYLMLGGKCRFCKQKISLRYPLIELLTACTFLGLYLKYGLSYDYFVFVIFICGLLIATFVDIQHRIIPDEVSVGGMILGFILISVRPLTQNPNTWNFGSMWESFLGIIAGGGIIYLTGAAFDLIFFKLMKHPPIQGETESMGGGDVKLLAMIGAFLGWKMALITFFVAPFFGLVVGVVNLIAKKDHTIPYGPFLSLAALAAMLWSDKIIALVIVR